MNLLLLMIISVGKIFLGEKTTLTLCLGLISDYPQISLVLMLLHNSCILVCLGLGFFSLSLTPGVKSLNVTLIKISATLTFNFIF